MKLRTFLIVLTAAVLPQTAAFSHATLETQEARVDSYYKAVMRVPHGCDGQSTLSVSMTIPEGMISVKPMPKPGWTLKTTKTDYAHTYKLHGREIKSGVTGIVWSGSLEDEHYDEFVFRGRVTDKLPVGKTVYIPTTQTCANGKVSWVEIPADGQNPHELKRPAPGFKVLAAAKGHGSAHGSHSMPPIKVGKLEISMPFVRATPPNAPVSAGYMVIRNTGTQADRLIGGTVDFAGKVEVHEMAMQGDVMKMRELPRGLEIPAGGEVTLKPGGLHIMFMKLKQQLKAGETREVTLRFEKAGTAELAFPVMNVKRTHSGHDGRHMTGDHGNAHDTGHGGAK